MGVHRSEPLAGRLVIAQERERVPVDA
jgi:hypothetical protein